MLSVCRLFTLSCPRDAMRGGGLLHVLRVQGSPQTVKLLHVASGFRLPLALRVLLYVIEIT